MSTLPKTNGLLDAAFAAHAADLCVIPSKSDGTKAPFGNWKQYQSERPDTDQLLTWFGGGRYHGMGLVCGAVSGRLECLEIEGAFAFRYGELRARLDSAGLLEEWDRWLAGYAERSPSGGVHVLVRIEGDGPLPGNTKLALGPDSATWIETRGEGGFVIVAPSGGPVHPSGKPWELRSGSFDDIAYTTRELWDAVIGVCMSFDESPAAAVPLAPPRPARQQGGDGSWIGAALEEYPDLSVVLQSHGWTFVREEPLGQLWRRPGKTHGHSGRVNSSGRFINFSSSTPLPVGTRQTLDSLDVDLAYKLGRMPLLDERTEALRQFKPAAASTSAASRVSDASRSLPVSTPVEATAAGNELNLPDSFWLERPYLSHVYAAALASFVSPDALWMGVKTLYAATVPYNFRLPGDGTLDYIGVMCGPSGSGKTQAQRAALVLMGGPFEHVNLEMPEPASGEGIVEGYLKRDKDGEQSLRYRGAAFYIDEGTSIFNTAGRAGSTTFQVIKSAWSGNMTGSLAAAVERRRVLQPRSVRFAMNIGIQPGVASKFMAADLTDGGLPQRICWSWSQHPHLADGEIEHPGTLDVPIFDVIEHSALVQITYCDELSKIVSAERRARVTGIGSVPLNGHETYAKLKSAALHCLMSGRTEVSMSDWCLASTEWDTSNAIRQHILDTQRVSASDSVRARGVARAYEDEAYDEVLTERALGVVIRRIGRSEGEGVTRQQLRDTISSYRRKGVDIDTVIDMGISRHRLRKDGDHYFLGEVR